MPQDQPSRTSDNPVQMGLRSMKAIHNILCKDAHQVEIHKRAKVYQYSGIETRNLLDNCNFITGLWKLARIAFTSVCHWKHFKMFNFGLRKLACCLVILAFSFWWRILYICVCVCASIFVRAVISVLPEQSATDTTLDLKNPKTRYTHILLLDAPFIFKSLIKKYAISNV